MEIYRWGSYRDYFGYNGLIDTEFDLGMFSHELEASVGLFKRFMNEKAEDNGLQYI